MLQFAASAQSLSSAVRGVFYRGEPNYIKECVWTNGYHPAPSRDARLGTQTARGLPETATSVLVTAAAVGTAAAFLMRTPKTTEVVEHDSKRCEACAGSGVCAECRGEGFVLKKLSQENAETARANAKNLATRFTAGLPKKWSYCTKCSSARYCVVCNGSGQNLVHVVEDQAMPME